MHLLILEKKERAEREAAIKCERQVADFYINTISYSVCGDKLATDTFPSQYYTSALDIHPSQKKNIKIYILYGLTVLG